MSHGKRVERTGALVLSAVPIIALGLLLAYGTSVGDEGWTGDRMGEVVVTSCVLAIPWIIAAQVLWRTSWRRTGARITAMDGPERLLAAATATLPEHRREWGVAMGAELAQIDDRPTRWRFAAGCACAAVFPLRGSRALVAWTPTIAAIAATWLATTYAVPGMRVFGVGFVTLVGVPLTLTAARARSLRRTGRSTALTVTALGSAFGCIALVVYYMTSYPSAAHALPTTTSVAFALVLAGCAWLSLSPPRSLVAIGRVRSIGIAMAIAMGVGLVVLSRLGLRGGFELEDGLMSQLLLVQTVVLAVGSAAAAVVGRSLRAGLQACTWASVLGVVVVVIAWLEEAPLWTKRSGASLLDADTVPIGANLGDALWWTLIGVVVLAVPFGVIAAALASRARRPRAREDAAPVLAT